MTKRREPLTYQLTLTRVAGLIGWDRVAHICGVRERAARNWSEMETESEIRMIDAERLDRACLEHGATIAPFYHLYGERLGIAANLHSAPGMARAAACAAKESGEAVAALIDAVGSNDPAVRRRARAEAEEAIEALRHALAAIDKHEKEG
ncbi:hypothetical protein [Novosphingobium huizhouense]|uniref:hypothetical protein n=1 Tax=Novosphingobium huizhouense TaxID=2866625 RepID=UPI001CD83963|nr:hypothetical protein [Novosphingobium huizhouense]